jgi:uncharacterized protein YjbI with pentapeptide repeats
MRFQEQTQFKKEYYKTDLTGADFTNLCSPSVRFKRSCLNEVILVGVDAALNMKICKAHHLDVTMADLTSSKIVECDLSFAYGIGVKLPHAELEEVNFTKADLRKSEFTNTIAKKCDFQGADLRGADFSDADFSDADFRGADLRGADFTGAKLKNALFDNCKMDEKTDFRWATIPYSLRLNAEGNPQFSRLGYINVVAYH